MHQITNYASVQPSANCASDCPHRPAEQTAGRRADPSTSQRIPSDTIERSSAIDSFDLRNRKLVHYFTLFDKCNNSPYGCAD